jgi:hypothetical protein
LPTQQENQSSSGEKSKFEKDDEPSDEQVRLFQESLQKNYGKPLNLDMNNTSATQGVTRSSLFQNKKGTDSDLDLDTNSK